MAPTRAPARAPAVARAPGAPSPDRASPRQRRRFDERDRRIREAAQRLLLERGLHGFSMDDVADAIDYSKGTVYLHYGNKEDALVASCVDACGELAAGFERAAAGRGRPRERMMEVAAAYCRYVREKPVAFRVIPVIHSPTVLEKVSPERLAAMEATRARCLDACGGIVRDAVASRDLVLPRALRPEAVTFTLWALLFGAFMLAELHRPDGILGIDDPTDSVRAGWAALMDGLGWRPISSQAGAPPRRRAAAARRRARPGEERR